MEEDQAVTIATGEITETVRGLFGCVRVAGETWWVRGSRVMIRNAAGVMSDWRDLTDADACRMHGAGLIDADALHRTHIRLLR